MVCLDMFREKHLFLRRSVPKRTHYLPARRRGFVRHGTRPDRRPVLRQWERVGPRRAAINFACSSTNENLINFVEIRFRLRMDRAFQWCKTLNNRDEPLVADFHVSQQLIHFFHFCPVTKPDAVTGSSGGRTFALLNRIFDVLEEEMLLV